ncbi:MAG: alpha/beta hydrolase [Caulobacter sp.]|nr:alpha/beta hydrolase [Caulobacter sp.]
MRIIDMGEAKVLVAAAEGPVVTRGEDALDFIGDAMGAGADTVAIPVARLGPAFLDLSSRLAGEVTQKFTNYRLRLAIVGDVSARVAQSEALAAYVVECNRGRGIWFVEDLDGLRARLER